MIHHPLNRILPLLIVPLITIIIKSLKKRQHPPRQRRPPLQGRNNRAAKVGRKPINKERDRNA